VADVTPPKPLPNSSTASWQASDGAEIVTLPLVAIATFTQARLKVLKDLRSLDQRRRMMELLAECCRRCDSGLPPLLDPVANMGIKDEGFQKLLRQVEDIEFRIKKHRLTDREDCQLLMDRYRQRLELENRVKELKRNVRVAQGMVFKGELKARKRILKKLGYCSAEHVVQMKGRVACEVDAGDEMLVCELLFNGVLSGLAPEVLAALLSCVVGDMKADKEGDGANRLRAELAAPFRSLQECARNIASVARDCRLEMDAEEYVAKFNPSLMEITFAWCRGAKFIDILKMAPSMFEGNIIRCMRRLDEVLGQVAEAARAVGNAALETSAKTASGMLKRDIVFAASLYL
jgi:ATP-dependent RNA helicase DOB1